MTAGGALMFMSAFDKSSAQPGQPNGVLCSIVFERAAAMTCHIEGIGSVVS